MPVTLREPSRVTTLLLALAGGLVVEAAFPQRSFWPAAILGVALLALALRRDSARWALGVGTLWGLTFFLVHIWWANTAVGIVPWVALSAAQALAIGLFSAAWVWIRRWRPVQRHAWLAVVAFATAWTAMEAARSAGPFEGFPWGRLAFSQTTGPLLRLAAVGGTALVTGVVAALGMLLATAWVWWRRRRSGSAVLALVLVLLVPIACFAVPLGTRAETGDVAVGVVQGNVSQPGLGAFDNAREVITNHLHETLALAASHAGDLDVVLWPENATDYDPRTDALAAQAVDEAALAVGAPILLGTQSYVRDDEGRAVARYNDVIRWDAGVGAVASYSKQHPAPFAEYIPFRGFFRQFSSAVDLVTVDMAKGTEVGILPVDVDGREVPFGIAICFEVAYDEIVRDSVEAGAEVLVVPTNNASFGYTAESEQQLAMSTFRAVEHGRAVVQVSTVGVSGIITPNGVVTQRTALFEPASMVADLPLRTSLTLATRLGPWPTWVAYGGSIALLALGIAGQARNRRSRPQPRSSPGGSAPARRKVNA